MLTTVISNSIRRKFFNKVLFVNVLIISIILIFLLYYIINTLTAMNITKEFQYNNVILNNLNDYFTNKYKIVQAISTQLYYDKYSTNNKYFVGNTDINEVFDFLQNNLPDTSLKYMEDKQAFDSYFASVFSRDDDMAGVNIYKLADGNIYQYTRLLNNIYPRETYKFKAMLEQINDPYKPVIRINPAVYPEYYDFSHDIVYTFSVNMKSYDLKENIGILMIDFNVNGIDRLVSKLEGDSANEIVILSGDNQLIYDSYGKYYGQKHPFANIIKNSADKAKVEIDNKSYIIKKATSTYADLTIVSAISVDNLLSKVKQIRYTIIFALLLCILICTVLMTLSSRVLSRRVKKIVDKIREIRKGDLSVKIPTTRNEDELDEISLSFNRMSEDLLKHIENSYGMELKQKNAELTALQAQVNPHFLYNTLETIRMKAIKNGDIDVGKMIYTLAKLFRNSIKGKTIIEIRDEIKYVELFLKIFKIRYETNFSYSFDIEREALGYGIPKLLLQPIAENYTMHGYNAKACHNFINIKIYILAGEICFTIEDNGKGIPPDKLSKIKSNLNNTDILHSENLGLLNINERIKIIYGTEYGLKIDSDLEKGTRVAFKIPPIYPEELNRYVQSFNG